MNSPGPSAFDIQSHLYTSFLEGRTADVALHVRGQWTAVYRLHRVVLIQSDFFRSLFTSGFRESALQGTGQRQEAEDIDIIFDDYNISRSAFEICIARLYGGGPPLYVFTSLIPTISQPLTPSFLDQPNAETVPDGHHPATPRFLLSLLATSIYLCIPSVASQAFSFILKTIGPHTVVQYLNFALGKTILYSTFFLEEPEAAVGLEDVARIVQDNDYPPASRQSSKGNTIDLGTKFSTIGVRETEVIDLPASHSSDSSDDDDGRDTESSSHHYGAISNKIGETCACWLVRWAIDLLSYETGVPDDCSDSGFKSSLTLTEAPCLNNGPSDRPMIWRRGGLDPTWVAAIISADTLFVRNERARYDLARSVVELRRRDGLLELEESHWKEMFEEGIYFCNMSVEDIIAISHDVSDITKQPFVPLATLQAALWSQSLLRHQIASKHPPVLASQVSLGLTQPATPPTRDKELGITVTTAKLAATSIRSVRSDLDVQENASYYPVLGDSSLRVGDSGSEGNTSSDGTPMPMSMEDLFTFSHSPSLSTLRQSSNHNSLHKALVNTTTKSSSESTFFGLQAQRHTPSSCITSDLSGKNRWSPFPPYRFGVEFWDIDYLKEKSRLHSHTIWYAGSLFNVYIQIVKKKGQAQLGIYLHRQSSIEPIPPASAPSFLSPIGKRSAGGTAELASASERPSHIRGPSLPSTLRPPILNTSSIAHYSPSIYPLSRSPVSGNAVTGSVPSSPSFSVSSASSGSTTIPSTATPVTPPQPYRDPRSSVSAYFMITCASATGSSQMRFASAPDVFSVSQSWGWKTSALRTEEYMDISDKSAPDDTVTGRSPINSLRATVILGLI